jgi:hypothetical protein
MPHAHRSRSWRAPWLLSTLLSITTLFTLTALVQAWLDGAVANNGVLLKQGDHAAYSYFFASPQYNPGNHRPRWLVRYQ